MVKATLYLTIIRLHIRVSASPILPAEKLPMTDQKDIYNQVLARLVNKQRLASVEQIRFCLSQVSDARDLGQVMIEHGLLDFENYLKFHNYIHKLFSSQEGRAKIREILGSAAPARAQAGTQSGTQSGAQSGAQSRPAAPSPSMDTSASFPTMSAPAPKKVVERVAKIAPHTPAPERPQPAAAAPPTAPTPPAAAPAAVAAVPIPANEILPGDFRGTPGDGQVREVIPAQLSASDSLDQILLFARKHRASDVHLSPGSPILIRRFSHLKPVSPTALNAEEIRTIIREGIPTRQLEHFIAFGDMEMAHTIQGGGRFRVTLVKQRFGWEITARVIPSKIRPFSESQLPPSCQELTKWSQGLVLVTGPMGSGKSTTLCTLVDLINSDRADHIISIEQPVEFVFTPKRCQITQRQVNLHTLSQANALRAALRQDPDIIVISELRNLESISLAVSAAETGHLVLATMNTANAQRTVNRIVDAFPPDEQEVVRNMISETLRGVISQQLVPLLDGNGLVPAYEVLIVTKAISNLIRKNNLHQLASAMLTGRGMGMSLLDDSLKKLLADGLIDGSEAFSRASDPRTFKQYAPDALKEIFNG